MTHTSDNFLSLIATIRQLRSEQGCPWDRKQTTRSLKKYLIEEFNEIIDAIDQDDHENLCEELGDFLYLILMIGEINRNEGSFTIEEIFDSINQKLIRRHPHVFSSRKELNESELRLQWNAIKEREKDTKNNS
ncbi:MAG: nucleotide pyrophosphohydrolase [Desulfofustis sp.]|nr:nucleotide pyrophosphohydrolase [Desulfofustis sp.]MBT8353241.1 nucleotide pyrophosphohydrolase [Desulfofustis sp.]NNF47018.1 nucleotide pyrophosphohydrolase [Desulfofustis sp.]NNK13214.1 nucleotide pyrophosphohydrolase [Desulfofustis sp.]NNK58528.1 nucleotide pyrophosphohydrolase [Desulfofustis sp.]